MDSTKEKESLITLSDAWQDWVVDNLLSGAPSEAVYQRLVELGVPDALAKDEVSRFGSPSVMAYLARKRRERSWAEQVVALRRKHLEAVPATVLEMTWRTGEAFYRECYAVNRPIVFRGLVPSWGVSHWTMQYLREQYGDTVVSVCTNRTSSQTPDKDFRDLQVSTSLRDFIVKLQRSSPNNDDYLIANNHALRDTPLRALLDDVILDDTVFDRTQLPRASSLWIGPEGTTTPTHHDISNILFGQIQGEKRVTLIAPHYSDRFQWDGYYAEPAHPPYANAPSASVTLTEGDALFIPAGWLHHVEAVAPSVCFSLLCFRRQNSFSDYRPGGVLGRRE